MQTFPVTHVFCGIAVRDFASAKGWYEQLFGRPPDMLPHDTEAVWNLVDGGLVYVVGDAERAGRGLLALAVEHFDETLAGTQLRGLPPPKIEVMDSGSRKATLTDPDGNQVALIQP